MRFWSTMRRICSYSRCLRSSAFCSRSFETSSCASVSASDCWHASCWSVTSSAFALKKRGCGCAWLDAGSGDGIGVWYAAIALGCVWMLLRANARGHDSGASANRCGDSTVCGRLARASGSSWSRDATATCSGDVFGTLSVAAAKSRANVERRSASCAVVVGVDGAAGVWSRLTGLASGSRALLAVASVMAAAVAAVAAATVTVAGDGGGAVEARSVTAHCSRWRLERVVGSIQSGSQSVRQVVGRSDRVIGCVRVRVRVRDLPPSRVDRCACVRVCSAVLLLLLPLQCSERAYVLEDHSVYRSFGHL